MSTGRVQRRIVGTGPRSRYSCTSRPNRLTANFKVTTNAGMQACIAEGEKSTENAALATEKQ